MKVKNLIEKLSKLPPEADILIGNRFVSDVMPIHKEITENILVKESLKHITTKILHDKMIELQTFDLPKEVESRAKSVARKIHKAQKYKLPNSFLSEEDYKKWYDKEKQIFILDTETQGKKFFDRMGKIEY